MTDATGGSAGRPITSAGRYGGTGCGNGVATDATTVRYPYDAKRAELAVVGPTPIPVAIPGPDPDDVAIVSRLLGLLHGASDDAAARFLLSSNWMRDRGGAAAARAQATLDEIRRRYPAPPSTDT